LNAARWLHRRPGSECSMCCALSARPAASRAAIQVARLVAELGPDARLGIDSPSIFTGTKDHVAPATYRRPDLPRRGESFYRI
jgi:hypothetical protein